MKRRQVAIAILQVCGAAIESNQACEDMIRDVEELLTQYKTNSVRRLK